MAQITEQEYEARALPELSRLIEALDELEGELDAELESDILTLEFPDGARFVVNSHRAARQIWMAANRSAWHFDWHPPSASWRTAKDGEELWTTLARVISEKLGRTVELTTR